jgi:hypothetical protein
LDDSAQKTNFHLGEWVSADLTATAGKKPSFGSAAER